MQNNSPRYINLSNGYYFLCTNYGHMAMDCEVFDRYNYHLQIPRSKFAGSQNKFHENFLSKRYMSDESNFDAYETLLGHREALSSHKVLIYDACETLIGHQESLIPTTSLAKRTNHFIG